MRMLSGRPRTRFHVVLVAAAWLLVLLAATSFAQAPPGLLPTPTPPPPSPTPVPTATPTPTASPAPSGEPVVPDPLQGSPSPEPSGSPASPSPSADVDVGGVDEAPDAFGLIPEGFEVPVIPRTAGRNTRELVARLERVTEVGIPLEEALIEGMGRFPVAGLAWYSDDWWNPRFTPYFHLHEGLDIFAEFGTPVRAPDSGVVTRVVDGPVGGIALWMRGRDGTQYYFAHLEGYAGGMEAGRTVETGTVIGYVGNTGNASGGAPHLHFEIHDPNAIPPKPFVDAWLGDAETAADAWVDARMADVLGHRELVRTERSAAGLLGADLAGPSATLEYSILLTVLDPVGGSVGLLPRLPLAPAPGTEVSDAMLREMLRLRVDGGLFSSSALRLPFGDGALRTAEAGAG